MQVRDGMSKVVLTVGPGHTLREAARLMADRRVGAAVVLDPDSPGPGILTERDLMDSLGRGQDPDTERVLGVTLGSDSPAATSPGAAGPRPKANAFHSAPFTPSEAADTSSSRIARSVSPTGERSRLSSSR